MSNTYQDDVVNLSADGDHHRYVALVRSPVALPRVAVGAFTSQNAPGPAKALFMTSMDLETAGAYAEAILATCEMARVELLESQAMTKQ